MLILQDNWDVSIAKNGQGNICLNRYVVKYKCVDFKFFKAYKYQWQIKSIALLIARPVNRKHRYKS